jgi:hypothetical protein
MKVASQKTLIVSDSQIKQASFMNWMAANVKSNLQRLHFCKFGDGVDKIVKYVDFAHASVVRRCVAVSEEALAEPLLIPLMSGAKTVVFFITRKSDSAANSIEKLSIAHRTLLRQSPEVFVLFSDGGREQASALESQLKTIGITPNYPELHTNDFRAIFDIIIDGDAGNAKSERGAASSAQAAAVIKAVKAAKPAVVNVNQTAALTPPAVIAQSEVKVNAESKTLEKEKHVVPVTAMTVSNSTPTPNLGKFKMANANESLATLMTIDGALGCFIADYTSGMVLAKAGSGVNLDIAAAGNTEVIKAKMKTMVALGIRESIEDILITLGTQYHIIRPMAAKQGLFLYIVLDKAKSNLAMARFKLLDAEKALTV